jgi:hypothetical protein
VDTTEAEKTRRNVARFGLHASVQLGASANQPQRDFDTGEAARDLPRGLRQETVMFRAIQGQSEQGR